MKDTGPQSKPAVSIPEMFHSTVEMFPSHLALHTRDRHGADLKWTYSQYMEEVRTAAKGFLALGLGQFHTVGILGYNSPQWSIANVATVHAGGFATGIYQTNTPAACEYVANHSRANVLVVENKEQLDKVLSIRKNLPHLRAIVQYEGIPEEEGVLSWQQLLQLGRLESDQELDGRLADIAANQCALLVYTSGTTGNPKGTMLSHDAVVMNSVEYTQQQGWMMGTERVVSYLPLSHVAGSMMDIYYPMSKGATTCFADSNALKGTLVENIKYYKPTRFLGVPRVWEKIEEKIKLAGKDTKGLKRKVADWAKKQALAHHLQKDAGIDRKSLGYKLAKKIVLSKVHEAIGFDQVVNQEMGTGGAVTSPETHTFFLSLDIRLLDVYGSTESVGCPQTGSLPGPGNCKVGTVGRSTPEIMENKINKPDEKGEGEIFSRGRCIAMGYLFDKEKTLETFDDDGWLHTGDKGFIDAGGFYTIVGRIKEIIITAGGENVAPVNIEGEIKKELPDIISNIMVVGEQRKFLTCLITLKVKPDPETLAPTDILEDDAREWVKEVSGEDVETVQQVLKLLEWDKWGKMAMAIDEGIERANKRAVSRAAMVQKWTIVPREFSVSGGELSPSLKLKRFEVMEMYKNEITEMYEHEHITSVNW